MRLAVERELQLQQKIEDKTILVVDDEAVIRELCSKVLKGYRVLQAEDGEAALGVLEGERVDVVLTDVMMPRLNGLDLLKAVKDKDPNKAVIIMTGYAEKDIILRALKADADDFISKPINLLQLKTTIEKVLEKLALKEELVHLKRIDQLKTDFLGLISHKLKTPITAISLFIQNLARGLDAPQDPGFQKTLSLILEESRYLGYLIKDLLYYSETVLQEGPPFLSRINLRDLVNTALNQLAFSAANKQLALTSELDGELPELEVDRRRIGFVLRALLENAIKFTPAGGAISVSTQVSEDRIKVIFRDTGAGIPQDELPKIFEKFYQVDPEKTGQVRGFGLGLFYARQFAQSHGGSIQLTSEPGLGTEATLVLPR
ncbi:hybrid sensor histidine kinase/response regulator [Desulfuromonas versatilis]|uniref:histidine kinase n=1 Tax=Desulfuromonas versatilis TaxID=2802975 RepID=A0ABN6E1H9_9BACT|nr:response regulator [Desulfuromonas versatilis]BCR06171.1 hybrid sensor histidine kinase/response regulator [Desulfuromonas versatilis]